MITYSNDYPCECRARRAARRLNLEVIHRKIFITRTLRRQGYQLVDPKTNSFVVRQLLSLEELVAYLNDVTTSATAPPPRVITEVSVRREYNRIY